MTLSANGVAIGKVLFNGVEIEKVYMNGTLVFETEATLTIGSSGGFYGLVGGGSISSDSISGYSGTVVSLSWDDALYDNIFTLSITGSNPYPAQINVTIGAVVIVMKVHYEGVYTNVLQNVLLPTSGTVKVKFEAIA